MNTYQARNIEFKELINLENWYIKVYTITKADTFDFPDYYEHVLDQLPKWLAMDNSFNPKHEKIGFLILHAATEGIFSIINWWVGKNMLNTHIFLTD
ncbi:MAG: hypothetical protein HRU26_17790, partial [Psychroserpens sp.]|nr:hypothetical protein [Psychroserpens sp.]